MQQGKLKNFAKIILWVARIWGSIFLLFLIFMVGGHLIGSLFTPGDSDGEGFMSVGEMLQFILLFPVGTMIGLAIALKWEGLGGFITTVAIVSLFIIRPDLISNPYMVGMGICGLLFLGYWALTRNVPLETKETRKEHRKSNRNNIIIALIISLIPLLAFIWSTILNGDNSAIITEKDSTYSKKVERLDVIVNIEEPLLFVFSHSFEHSLVSAFELNGVDAFVTILLPESSADIGGEPGANGLESTFQINIKPLYRERDDGSKVIVGTDYEASLVDVATNKRVWHATGKVDYILKTFSNASNYNAGEGIRKEFAWKTTADIVNAFITEVNNQEPIKTFTVTESRKRNGQRVD